MKKINSCNHCVAMFVVQLIDCTENNSLTLSKYNLCYCSGREVHVVELAYIMKLSGKIYVEFWKRYHCYQSNLQLYLWVTSKCMTQVKKGINKEEIVATKLLTRSNTGTIIMMSENST